MPGWGFHRWPISGARPIGPPRNRCTCRPPRAACRAASRTATASRWRRTHPRPPDRSSRGCGLRAQENQRPDRHLMLAQVVRDVVDHGVATCTATATSARRRAPSRPCAAGPARRRGRSTWAGGRTRGTTSRSCLLSARTGLAGRRPSGSGANRTVTIRAPDQVTHSHAAVRADVGTLHPSGEGPAKLPLRMLDREPMPIDGSAGRGRCPGPARRTCRSRSNLEPRLATRGHGRGNGEPSRHARRSCGAVSWRTSTGRRHTRPGGRPSTAGQREDLPSRWPSATRGSAARSITPCD